MIKLKTMQKIMLFVVLISLFSSCKDSKIGSDKTNDPVSETYYAEKFRPQFHFSPEEQWMNDPNGLVYHDDTYHLFYQFHPDSTVWGPMHWGHATSADLISWEHQEIALEPDSLGYIFSGSAVVDKDDTSGFGANNKPPLVAIFTYHSDKIAKQGRDDFETQGIAYSLDNGKSWTKYADNPVIKNEGLRDFRDPKVFWHAQLKKWVMALVARDHVKFYQSDNLKEWTLSGEFGKGQGSHGGVWECPDLFKLPVNGQNQEKWVLLVSVQSGGPQGGSATQYFVGDFDGSTFTTEQKEVLWLDSGKDNYAGVTYNNEPTANRILIGWMSNWQYAQKVPTEKWRSAMTLPRSLKLFANDSSHLLKNYPIKNFDRLLTERESLVNINLEKEFHIDSASFEMVDIKLNFTMKDDILLKLSNPIGEEVFFGLNPKEGLMYFDRDTSGATDFDTNFAKGKQIKTYTPKDEVQEIRVIVDKSSIEIFVNEGEHVFTNTVFPSAPYTSLTLSSTNAAQVHSLSISDVQSIWK